MCCKILIMENNKIIISDDKSKNDVKVQTTPVKNFTREIVLDATIIFILSTISVLMYYLFTLKAKTDVDVSIISQIKRQSIIDLFKSFDKNLLFTLLISFFGYAIQVPVLILIKPSNENPIFGLHHKNLLLLAILDAFGMLASFVLPLFLCNYLSVYVSLFLSYILVYLYGVFVYKLYLEERTFSNKLFWELFRFAIVGLIAAVFDLIMCSIFQFVVFKENTNWYVTVVSTIMGFIVGVTINYLMSTYMVFKNQKSNKSKTTKGIITFVTLSAIGLLIGIGIQYLLYDIFNLKLHLTFFSYTIVFIIRTLIVMVYNYISRKLIIYNK